MEDMYMKEVLENPMEEKEVESKRGPKEKWKYTKSFAYRICQKIAEGMSLEDVCNEEGIPCRWVISKWRMEHSEFNEMIKFARQIRAEFYHDEAIKVSRQKKTKDDVPGAALEVSTLKWAAQVNDPGTFGAKLKVENEYTKRTTFVIETGIRRDRNEDCVVDEPLKIKEAGKIESE